MKKFFQAVMDIVHSRELIFNLAKNDFKTKYVGSFLGMLWAFIRPIITVLVYWFVFQVGLGSSDVNGCPFVLWLLTGLVPWFYFSDVLGSGTAVLIEYQYLVKKIVFNISTLPIVKVISSLFVHLFFTALPIIVYCCYGNMPHLYMFQILYYMFCMVAFLLALVYFTSSVVLFFKDTMQIIGVIIEIGIWMTPIMWQLTLIPEQFRWVFKLNPMYYIVYGYRDSIISKVWFWDRPVLSIYFWIVTILLFIFGVKMFNKLKVHFADVL
ncbi:MAG: ABC transporter permease [Lachnospiraceae bacterium]|nr:ABC transporter permease [Lachnospiraceae bacterium]